LVAGTDSSVKLAELLPSQLTLYINQFNLTKTDKLFNSVTVIDIASYKEHKLFLTSVIVHGGGA